jgi:hypothetical protein
MNNLTWILANCALLATAYGVTVWVRDYEPRPSWSTQIEEEQQGASQGRPQSRPAADDVQIADSRLGADELDDLWKNTLFRPERTEEVADPDAEETEEKAPDQVQLELIGVGKIGDKPVAIILEKTPVRRAIRRRIRRPGAPEVEEEESPAKTQHIYREGAEVGDTGYTVSRIDFNEVLLVRGDEELTLKLEAGDDQSQGRRDRAVASAKAREAEQAAEEAKEEKARETAASASPGSPPPPPPPPVAAPSVPAPEGGKTPPKTTASGETSPKTTAGSTSAMTREERLRRAKLLRERILQRRQEQQQEQAN